MLKLNTDIFIEKAKQIHNDKYDYSFVNYTTSKTCVKIICPIHGEFEQAPQCHINRKQGCPKCGILKCGETIRKTTEVFIKESKKIYGDIFDYSLVNYINSDTKIKLIYKGEIFEQVPQSHLKGHNSSKIRKKESITENFIKQDRNIHGDKYDYSLVNYVNMSFDSVSIICPKHGVFEQYPQVHLERGGCILCKREENFIKTSKKIHNDKYDYSLVNYVKQYKEVKIICPIHGVFDQSPKNHHRGECKKCADDKKRWTTEEFIEKVKEIHNNKYDYSLVEYINIYEKVKIICSKHGEFNIRPTDHLKGCGCQLCGIYNRGNNYRYTTDKFIEKSREIHGNLFDYSKSEYIDNGDCYLTIICKKHGEFTQQAKNHLSGRGCSICNESKSERKIEKILKENGYIYERQKKFIDCRNILPLPFDFYLNDYNICIEYDGEHL